MKHRLSRSIAILGTLLLAAEIPVEARHLAFVPNPGEDTVSIIDTHARGFVFGEVLATVPVGALPYGVAVHPSARTAYVTNLGSNTISVIDALALTVIDTIPVGVAPLGIAVHPDGKSVYVVNQFDDNVSIIDTATRVVTETVAVGARPTAVAFSPDGLTAWISNWEDDTVSVLDTTTRTITATIPVGDGPFGIAVHPGGSVAYVTCTGSTSQARERVLAALQGQMERPADARGSSPGEVSVIDTSTLAVIASVPVGIDPVGVAFHPAGGTAYVANSGDDNVSVIDVATHTEIDTVVVGAFPTGVAADPNGDLIWVANTDPTDDRFEVSLVSHYSRQEIGRIEVGFFPYGLGEFVAPDTLGGSVATASLEGVRCLNRTSGQEIRAELSGVEFDCEELGLVAEPGDRLTIWLSGVAEEPLSEVYVPTESGVTAVVDASVRISEYSVLETLDDYYRGAIHPDGRTLYAGRYDPARLDFIDVGSLAVTDSVDLDPDWQSLALDPGADKLYVAGSSGVEVIDVNTKTVIDSGIGCAGNRMEWITVHPSGHTLYIADLSNSAVAVVDAATLDCDLVLLFAGHGLGRTAIHPDGSLLYVPVSELGTVSVIDTATNAGIASIPVGGGPVEVAVHPSGDSLWVAEPLSNSVVLVDLASLTVTGNLPAGDSPLGIAFSPEGDIGYVGDNLGGSLSVIDVASGSLSAEIDLPEDPFQTIPSPAGPWIFVLQSSPSRDFKMSLVRSESYAVDRLLTASEGHNSGVAAAADGRRVYFANPEDDTVNVYDTLGGRVSDVIQVGTDPKGVVVLPDGDVLYVSNSGDDSVAVVDTATGSILETIPVGDHPKYLAVLPDGSRVYVANLNADTVSVIDTDANQVLYEIGVGDGPLGLAVHPSGQFVYVPNQWDGTLSVIETNSDSVVTEVTGLLEPARVTVHPDGTRIYVSESGGETIAIIETAGHTVADSVLVGSVPWGLTIEPESGDLFVATEDDGAWVVDTTFDASITPIVLPASSKPLRLAVVRRPLGGAVSDLDIHRVTCGNRSTGQRVSGRPTGSSWSCEELGLEYEPDDPVLMVIFGTFRVPDAPAFDGGSGE